MSAPNVRPVPGTMPRNGMPPSRDYVYRGLGYDQLDPTTSQAGLRRQATMRQELAGGFTPYSPAPEPVTVAPQQVGMCRACLLDMCDTCFGGTCRCACIDYAPAVIKAAANPEPEPPGRCEVCGYLLTAPGHLLSCGTPDAIRIGRLASAIGRR